MRRAGKEGKRAARRAAWTSPVPAMNLQNAPLKSARMRGGRGPAQRAGSASVVEARNRLGVRSWSAAPPSYDAASSNCGSSRRLCVIAKAAVDDRPLDGARVGASRRTRHDYCAPPRMTCGFPAKVGGGVEWVAPHSQGAATRYLDDSKRRRNRRLATARDVGFRFAERREGSSPSPCTQTYR